ncbi:MAG: glycosyltransferase [Terriglobales bacterium]
MNGKAGVIFRAAIYGGSGYADGSQDVLAGLEQQGVRLQLVPIGLTEDRDGLLPESRRRELQRLQRHRFDTAASILYQCAPAPDFLTSIEARVRIGRVSFETDSLPPGWSGRCNALDEIWVPSTFNRDSFARGGVDEARLRVMPEGLDTGRYRPGLEPLPLPERRGFNFLSVFDWIDRKGADVLLRAYCRAFDANDDVALILKVHKFDDPSRNLEEHLLYVLEREMGLRLEQMPAIVLLTGLLPAADMPRLYASADAFVLSSRGEGWGRPYMEAAASEMPVLATRWSGHLDFLNDENAYLIDLEAVAEVPLDSDREIYMGQRWAEPSAEHLAQLMRVVYSDREAARAKAARARQDMVTLWDRSVLAPRWAAALRALLS